MPVDIFLAHNAPRGVNDRPDGIHNGFTAFGDYIERVRPSLFIHGHQHADKESMAGGTRVIGVHGFRLLDLKTGEVGNKSGSMWCRYCLS